MLKHGYSHLPPTQDRERSWSGQAAQLTYAGFSDLVTNEQGTLAIVIAIRDATHLVDFFTYQFSPLEASSPTTPSRESTRGLLAHLHGYSQKHQEKLVAVGLSEDLERRCPGLCSLLWRDLDALPLVLKHQDHARRPEEPGDLCVFTSWEEKTPDEQADSMARKCLRSFGVGHLIHNQIHANGMVDVDKSFCVRFAAADDYRRTVSEELWGLTRALAQDLVARKVKMAFFSMTCQGKPDVHTRHALVRLCHILGVDVKWYVPKPRPNIQQLIRKMEDIMEGLADPAVDFETEDQLQILEFAYENARRHWLGDHGPLRGRHQGGADVVVIDSAPLLTLALLAKQHDPERPVVFENRLHAPSDVLSQHPALAQVRAWRFVQARLEHVDSLITTLPRELAPGLMAEEKVGYILPSVDQLDGLNKAMTDSDMSFYGQELNSSCRTLGTPGIQYPKEQYILSLSQLRPGDGTLALLDAYATFCRSFLQQQTNNTTDTTTDNNNHSTHTFPKLLICHHGPSRSPENSPQYEALLSHIHTHMPPSVASRVCIIQLSAQDQMWNTLLSNAHVVVQLALCQGIPEVLVWAMRKHRPLITVAEGGLVCAFAGTGGIGGTEMLRLVDSPSDVHAVSRHLDRVFADREVSQRMTQAPSREECLSEAATTVGNAACWMFLASRMSRDKAFQARGRNVAELVRLDGLAAE
ncbi:putative heat shock trehalose synthase [Aspergillus saccharolyticus JOP 1030-1]|uniref:Trehalose synthase N-terminal domain-containing protein n=1 Tax=Aspergillus saccharolyticus JOP 1030-1 TaxID=1450539 RepID=A0A318ZGW3_9EURO|nr:hypothetical protein BP01DRAFT_318946 [Aspergillus saccharolyticus JOP 1030-1]PYH45604.1 hypothetical protein BP01DRAFT_318946 [Aspergillus saccharolyticus JOP 1030-1]